MFKPRHDPTGLVCGAGNRVGTGSRPWDTPRGTLPVGHSPWDTFRGTLPGGFAKREKRT